MHPSVSPYKQNQQFNIFVSSIFHSFILPFLPGYLQKVPFLLQQSCEVREVERHTDWPKVIQEDPWPGGDLNLDLQGLNQTLELLHHPGLQ